MIGSRIKYGMTGREIDCFGLDHRTPRRIYDLREDNEVREYLLQEGESH